SSNRAGNASAAVQATGGSGGAIDLTGTTATIANCRFSGNLSGSANTNGTRTPGVGGAVRSTASLQITNTLVTGNQTRPTSGAGATSASGGAIRADSVAILTNVTVAANATGGAGGGLALGPNAQATVTNSIFWNNSDVGGTDESAQIDGFGTNDQLNYSCVQG